MSRIPAYLVTGVSPTASATTALGLHLDLPDAVLISHDIDAAGQQLYRTVSDLHGVHDKTTIDLRDACVPCAIRGDVTAAIAQAAATGRWKSVVARLPVGADAVQICRLSAHDSSVLGDAKIDGVVASLDGCAVLDDLTGPALMCERDSHAELDDERGVAEVATRLVEYADVVAVDGPLTDPCADLVGAISAPHARLVPHWSTTNSAAVVTGVHDHDAIEDWVDEIPPAALPHTDSQHVWRLRLSSTRPMHPERLHDHLEALGGGAYRSRGCFWVPTRPRALGAWDGAGGQLSIGAAGRWSRRCPRRTDLVLTGLYAHGDPRAELQAAFEAALVTPDELGQHGETWHTSNDGLEAWMGDIEEVA